MYRFFEIKSQSAYASFRNRRKQKHVNKESFAEDNTSIKVADEKKTCRQSRLRLAHWDRSCSGTVLYYGGAGRAILFFPNALKLFFLEGNFGGVVIGGVVKVACLVLNNKYPEETEKNVLAKLSLLNRIGRFVLSV